MAQEIEVSLDMTFGVDHVLSRPLLNNTNTCLSLGGVRLRTYVPCTLSRGRLTTWCGTPERSDGRVEELVPMTTDPSDVEVSLALHDSNTVAKRASLTRSSSQT